MPSGKPRIAITMGDPAGVGPELCCQLLKDPAVLAACVPVVFGNAKILQMAAERCSYSFDAQTIDAKNPAALVEIQTPAVFDLGGTDIENFEPGVISQATGADSFAFIQAAIDAARDGHVAGVATGPINKAAWKLAGINFPGHTELFAERFETEEFCMMMTSPAFSCSLVTTHIGYHEVPQVLTADLIHEVIELTHSALERIVGRKPKLVVLGLNPHAGEDGLFGNNEEEKLIAPAIERAVAAGIDIKGPIPPDTGFLPWRREQTDGYVCMYHDQGLIPFKAFNFDSGVNITLGLPMVRTSVDHGTALDIAWQGKADVSSFISAVKLAASLGGTNL